MSSQRDWTADAYPTRRQLREAARAAQPTDPAPAAASSTSAATPAAVAEPAPTSAPATLTRRQLRERARAEQAGQAAAQGSVSGEPTASSAPAPADDDVLVASADEPFASDERPSAVAANVAADERPVTPPARTSWAEIVPGSRASKAAQKSPARRWLPRLAVLGALAALTTVVPLTGAALPTTSSDPSTGTPLAEASALDVFSSGGTQISTDASAALAADPLASVRSMVATSRSDERSSTCAAGAMEANGVLASEVEVVITPEVMMPLSEGSYHYTSRYGVRAHPIFGSYGEHTGLDMAAAAGTPIHAVADGTVVHAGNGMDGRSSMLVIIEHEVDGQPIWTWYVHMYPNGVYVSEGQQVSAGEVIGAVGSYGNSTGPHLHFEVHLDEAQTTIDPESWLASTAAPLNSETLQCAEG
ncbi:peptidoglycan DD-metalloendopeptidase family protein [Ruania zhangjianzhongii]|uniref:peptidoglycan DD-metalloendopeptidase family protein n=1 Tax=Ruania zhangjianzhongii TaxID=2603206 RepID=UPI0011CB784F|nr:peptidoglycan DD-metalloendopeptidase family protein [Ruania zhangjianzhongii]